MKKITFIFILLVLFVGLMPAAARAQEPGTDYVLLQPIPLQGGGDTTEITNPGQYIGGVFMLIIGLAGVLAVIYIIVGGIQYMSTDAFQGKNEAKTRIQNAIFGLLLALGAWIILYSVNERLVSFDLNIQRVGPASTSTDPSAFGQPWGDDSSIRATLEAAGITFNNNNCATIGQTGCTSVYGLNGSIINLLRRLEQDCSNCTTEVTGGTEYWLHGNRTTNLANAGTEHIPGGRAVDLGLDSALTVFLRFQGQATTASGCAPGSQKYVWNGATFVLEGNHWHVCMYTIPIQ